MSDTNALLRRLLESHQKMSPHHHELCQLCKDTEAQLAAHVAQQEPLLQRRDQSADSRYWQLVPKNLSDEMYAIVKEVAPRWNAASVWTNLLGAAPVAAIDGAQGERQPFGYVDAHGSFYSAKHGLAPFPNCTTVYSA